MIHYLTWGLNSLVVGTSVKPNLNQNQEIDEEIKSKTFKQNLRDD